MLSHRDSQHAHRHKLHEVLRLHSNFTMRLIIVPNYWTYVTVTVYLCWLVAFILGVISSVALVQQTLNRRCQINSSMFLMAYPLSSNGRRPLRIHPVAVAVLFISWTPVAVHWMKPSTVMKPWLMWMNSGSALWGEVSDCNCDMVLSRKSSPSPVQWSQLNLEVSSFKLLGIICTSSKAYKDPQAQSPPIMASFHTHYHGVRYFVSIIPIWNALPSKWCAVTPPLLSHELFMFTITLSD